MSKQLRAFSLVELLVTITIVALLATAGVSMYTSMVNKTKSSSGNQALAMIAAKQELYKASRNRYAPGLTSLDLPGFENITGTTATYEEFDITYTPGTNTWSATATADFGAEQEDIWDMDQSMTEPVHTQYGI